MIKSMFSAVAGLRSHQTLMDVIGNNIANVNTMGYKSSRVIFKDIYYQTIANAGAPTATSSGSNPMQIGSGATVSSIDVQNTRSGYQQTYRPLDMYISGEGYFVTENSSGQRSYTRVGSFSFDINGSLVDGNGNFVCGDIPALSNPVGDIAKITIDKFDEYSGVTIGADGKITGVKIADGKTEELAQIALAAFPNPSGLSQEGGLSFTQTVNSGAPTLYEPGKTAGLLISGGLEMSNVDLSKEFTDMIIAQRGFQANSRVITTSDEVLQELVGLKR